MSGGFIKANMNEMMTTGAKVMSGGQDFKNETDRLYQAIDDLSSRWQGEDNKAYYNKVNEYKDDMLNLAKVITSYGEFIKATAQTYSDVSSDIAAAAGKL